MLNRRLLGVVLASFALVMSAALPAVATPITEIEVVQEELGESGIMIEVTGDGGIGPLGELLLGVSGMSPGVVMHDEVRIEFNRGPSFTRFVIEGLAFDWNTGWVTGFVGAIQEDRPLFGGELNVFRLDMREDGSFNLFWTEDGAEVFQSVFGSQGGVVAGVLFGIADLGVDPHEVPEPATLMLMMGGLLGLAGFARRPRS